MAIFPEFKLRLKAAKLEKIVENAKQSVYRPGHLIKNGKELDIARLQFETIDKLRETLEKHFTHENGTVPETSKRLVLSLIKKDMPMILLQALPKVDDAARGSISTILSVLFGSGYSVLNKAMTEYMKLNAKKILASIESLYEHREVALYVGPVMRSCLAREERFFVGKILKGTPSFVEHVLQTHMLSNIEDFVKDSIATLNEILVPHNFDPRLQELLLKNYTSVSSVFNKVLSSGNVMAKRGLLQILHDVLLSRENYEFRCSFVSDGSNFQAIWDLFESDCPCFEAQARTILKLFVANPNKSKQVEELLGQNKAQLIQFVAKSCDRKSRSSVTESNELIKALHHLDPVG